MANEKVVKKVTEKSIRNVVRRMFKRINTEKEYAFLILMSIFTTMVFYKPNTEKMIAYVFSLCIVQYVILKDEQRIINIKIKKNNVK